MTLVVFVFAWQAATTERAELAAAMGAIRQLAEPHLRVQPTDTTEVLALRHRLAQLVDFTTRYVTAYDHQPMCVCGCANLVQVFRGISDDGRRLLHHTSKSSEALSWHLAAWVAGEKALALYQATRPLLPPVESNPSQRPDPERQVELHRQAFAQALVPCVWWLPPYLR